MIKEPFIAHSELTHEIYVVVGKEKYCVTKQAIKAVAAIKALEQEPCEDIMTIHTQGLDEGIRCAMCTNSMKSNRGCDGGCVVNEAMYKEVMNTIRNHIVPSATPTRKKGHWIEGQTNNPNIHNILCSCCFEGYPSKGHANSQHTKEKFKYCPNCGSKMERE